MSPHFDGSARLSIRLSSERDHPHPGEDSRHLFTVASFALGCKLLIGSDQEELGHFTACIALILIDWHISPPLEISEKVRKSLITWIIGRLHGYERH